MLGWVGCHAFPNVIARMQSSDSPPPSAEALVPLAAAYLKDELLFLTDGCASSQAFPSLGDWSPGLPSPGSCFEERSGPPRFLGRPLTPCHGRPPRRIRDHLAHRSVIMMLPSGIPRPWASGTVCVSRLHSRGPIVRLPTHRRGDYPPRRKAGFRPAGLRFGRTGFAPSGRQTEFPESRTFFLPFGPACLVASGTYTPIRCAVASCSSSIGSLSRCSERLTGGSLAFPELSNFDCLPGRAGGTPDWARRRGCRPRVLRRWSAPRGCRGWPRQER